MKVMVRSRGQWFLTQGNFAPMGDLATAQVSFWLSQQGRTEGHVVNIWRVEARDAAQHPTIHRTATHKLSGPIV